MSGTTKILKSNPFQIHPLNKKQIMDLGLLNTEVSLIIANPTYNRDNAIWEKKHVALLKPKKKRNEPGKKYLARRVEVTKAKAEKEEAPVDELIWPDEQPFKLGKFQLPKDWFDQDENDKQIQQTKGKLSRSGKTLSNFYGGPPFPALVYLTLRQGEQASPGETKSAAPPPVPPPRVPPPRVPPPDFSTIPVPIVPEVPTGETKLQHQPTTMHHSTAYHHAHNPIEIFSDGFRKVRLEQEKEQAASKIQAIQRGNTTRRQKAKQEALALAEENARIEQEQLRQQRVARQERSDARFKEKNPAPKDPRYSGGRKRRRKTKRKSKRKTRKHKKKHRRKTKRKRRVKRRRRTRRR